MNALLTISITCEHKGPVQLRTRERHTEMDGDNRIIHYRAYDCPCGIEHYGCVTESFAATHVTVEA